jgi:antitoxin YefM
MAKISGKFHSTKISTYIRTILFIHMKTTNYSDLRSNLKTYLDSVVNDSEPLIIHRSGNNSVVVISLDEYNAIKETEYITSSPAMMQRLQNAEKNMNAGKGVKINIDEL